MKTDTIYKNIKVSRNWDLIKPFSWLCENARFVFLFNHGRERLYIVTKESIEGYDCFEISNDRYGIIPSSSAQFSVGWGKMIEDSSLEIIPTIRQYIIRSGATDLVGHLTPITSKKQ